jgi:APA family basic amino acid/polyamine antiporter
VSNLKRQLGPVELTSIVVGGIIGSGIFISPAIVARETGSAGASILVWVVGGVIATCGGLCYAELSAAIPETGGTYVFLRRAYRWPMVAFLFGWAMFFASFTGAIAAVASAFAEYAGYFLEPLFPYGPMAKRVLALALILGLTAVNYVSVRWGGKVQNVATMLKVGALVGLIVVGLALGSGGALATGPLFASSRAGGAGITAFGTALIAAVFAYNGWSYSSYVGGEARNPSRNLPLSILLGIAIVLVVYLLVNVALMKVLPLDQLAATSRPAAAAMEAVLGRAGGGFIAVAVMISTFGAANAVMLSCSRAYFAMAEDGLFFRALERVHPKFQTPANAILVQGLVAGAFAVSGSFEQILTYYAFVDYVFFIMAIAAVMVLRRTEPNLPRPYKVWGYPITPLVFIAIVAWYVINTLIQRPAETAVGVALTLAGVPFYLYWTRQNRAKAARP